MVKNYPCTKSLCELDGIVVKLRVHQETSTAMSQTYISHDKREQSEAVFNSYWQIKMSTNYKNATLSYQNPQLGV